MSPSTPYSTADIAHPPTDADEIKPIIAPLFFSGRASIIDELNIAFPTAFNNAPMKPKIHIVTNSFDKNAAIINISDRVNPIAKIQKRALGPNFMIPKSNTPTREAKVQTDISKPYCSTENPFSIVNGRLRVK